MTKRNLLLVKILSITLLLCSLFVPMFDVLGGIIPSEYAWSISETFEAIADEGISAMEYYGVQLHLCTWILGGILCLGSFVEKKKIIATSSVIGMLLLIMIVVNNMNQYSDSLYYLMNFDDGNYTIGYWIVLGVFIACSIISLMPIKESEHI